MTTELEALAMGADLIDADTAATAPEAVLAQAEADQAVSQVQAGQQQLAMLLGVAVPVLGKLYPSLERIYTPETQEAVAASVAPVLVKYGIDLGEWGSAWKEEIMMVVVCGPIVMATVKGIKEDAQAQGRAAPAGDTLRVAPSTPPSVPSDVPERLG